MTLAKSLQHKLTAWRPAETIETLTVAEGAWTARVTSDCNDQLACRVRELALHKSQAIKDVKTWAESSAGLALGLPESLALMELDADRKVAQLRGSPPGKEEGELSYFEVLLHGEGKATVRRYQNAASAGKREQIAFTLTHEALGKLVRQLASV